MHRLCVPLLALTLAACVAPPPAVTSLPKYTIFFGEWSGRLDDPSISTIAAAADAAKQNPTVAITVKGYADPTGSADANHYVSQLRSQMVTDQLVADGIPPARIVQSALGATDFVGSSQESRRVVIGVGAP